jgi:hypothetical protein
MTPGSLIYTFTLLPTSERTGGPGPHRADSTMPPVGMDRHYHMPQGVLQQVVVGCNTLELYRKLGRGDCIVSLRGALKWLLHLHPGGGSPVNS